MRRHRSLVVVAVLLAAVVPSAARAGATADRPRDFQPVVLTGADLPALAGPAAKAIAPNAASDGESLRHSGEDDTLWVVPPTTNPPVLPSSLFVFRWDGAAFEQVPFQVDERFERYLRVGPFLSDQASVQQRIVAGKDALELSYAFDQEPWRKTAGTCEATYRDPDHVTTADPQPLFDTDDEIAFLFRDAGEAAPAGAPLPPGVWPGAHEVRITDPLDRSTRAVYVFTSPSLAPAYTAANGYVSYQRDADADRYVVALGPNPRNPGPTGPVCDDTGAIVADSVARLPKDGATVTSARYQFRYEGRWLFTSLQVAGPSGSYGPDLVDHFKGRTLSTSNDANTGVGAFEDEYWWNNTSILLGERAGPVRVIRESWGAASGANVTKLEVFYPELIEYRLNYRVHAIAGVWVYWDYNRGAATTYFNRMHPPGVPIDGRDDEIAGNLDLDVSGMHESVDVPDPTHQPLFPFGSWEEVSGPAGALVYLLENRTPLFPGYVIPYYRDDGCFDDGTGDDPGPTRSGLPCGEGQGAYGDHGLSIGNGQSHNDLLPASYANGLFVWSQFVLPPGAGNVGESFASAAAAPLVVSVSTR